MTLRNLEIFYNSHELTDALKQCTLDELVFFKRLILSSGIKDDKIDIYDAILSELENRENVVNIKKINKI